MELKTYDDASFLSDLIVLYKHTLEAHIKAVKLHKEQGSRVLSKTLLELHSLIKVEDAK